MGGDPGDQIAYLLLLEAADPSGDAPPAVVTSSAVSSMVSGRFIGELGAVVVRPVT